tara:strand:+ start:229 stop:462 length:234 start_codon:yes stop_codon:yes gene_type:complete
MERSQEELLRAERLIRAHIRSAVNSRRIEPAEAGKQMSDLIEKNHPNKFLAILIGIKMQAEKKKNLEFSCAFPESII